MKLLIVFSTCLAIALAEAETIEKAKDSLENTEEVENVDILRSGEEFLRAAASSYANSLPPSQRPPRQWSNYNNKPQNTWNNPKPVNTWNPPQNNYNTPQNNYNQPQNDYIPPQNTYYPPQNNYNPPQNNYNPPQNNYNPPQNNYNPPQNEPYQPPQALPTTTPVPVIKNEQNHGPNGSYDFEYQIADGTHVGEHGYIQQDPKSENGTLVKKGWYSFTAEDGKVYTVTWWADESGYHASGDHLPTPPPVPAAIQAALDQAAKDEAEKNKQQQTYYPSTQPTQQNYYPQQPAQNYPQQPAQQNYYPQQPTQTYPQQPAQQNYYPQKPTQTYPQQPAQQNYYPQQPTQQTFYPQQPTNQQYYPSQPTYG